MDSHQVSLFLYLYIYVLGLKLLMDFVINHTSDQHPWFKKSVDKIEPYTDYYVWVNCSGYDKNGDPIPPNNWVSIL